MRHVYSLSNHVWEILRAEGLCLDDNSDTLGVYNEDSLPVCRNLLGNV